MAQPIPKFRVRNFEQFQHYKDRNPIWIKLYNSLLDDYDFGHLPDASKAHLLAIWLLASRYDNLLPLDAQWIGSRIQARSPVDLNGLLAANFIIAEQPVGDVASELLAVCEQVAIPEKRREREEKNREEKKDVVQPDNEAFEAWWKVYPRKEGKGDGRRAYAKALTKTDAATLLAAAERYRDIPNRTMKFTKMAATWLNAECWSDEEPDVKLSEAERIRADYLDQLEREETDLRRLGDGERMLPGHG